jgi:hypothetical protein
MVLSAGSDIVYVVMPFNATPNAMLDGRNLHSYRGVGTMHMCKESKGPFLRRPWHWLAIQLVWQINAHLSGHTQYVWSPFQQSKATILTVKKKWLNTTFLFVFNLPSFVKHIYIAKVLGK